MIYCTIGLVSLAALLPAQTTREQEQLDSVLVAIDDQWRMCRSVQADLFMSAEGAGSETKGKYYYLVKGKKQLFREEQHTANYGKNRSQLNPITWQDVLMVGDGTYVINMVNRMGTPVTYKTKQVPGQGGRGGTGLLNKVKNTHELTLMPTVKIERRDTWVIRATPVTSGAAQEETKLYYYDQMSGLMVKMVRLDGNGEPKSTMELLNLETGMLLDEDLFVYKARPAENIIDMTQKKTGG